MSTYSRSHLSNSTLLDNLTSHLSTERSALAEVLADLAEVDTRKLYLQAGFSSLHAWCVGVLHLSEEAAAKRIYAARTARRFPAVFSAVAEGHLHLSAVVMLASHFSEGVVDELIELAAHRSRSELALLLAERYPRPDLPTRVLAVGPPPPGLLLVTPEHSPGNVAPAAPKHSPANAGPAIAPPAPQHSPGNAGQVTAPPAPQHSPGNAGPVTAPTAPQHSPGNAGSVAAFVRPGHSSGELPGPRSRLAPLAPQRFALQVTIGQRAHDNLRYAQELLSHRVASCDVANILDRALELYVRKLEKRKFAATERPARRRSAGRARYVPAEVRRAVWRRDGGQCTFLSDSGRRCSERKRLEFDHVHEYARGGPATAENLRLRCRGHNQHAAEQTFGANFMNLKRQARRVVAGKPVAPCAAPLSS